MNYVERLEKIEYYSKGKDFDLPCKICSQFIEEKEGNMLKIIFGRDFSPVILKS